RRRGASSAPGGSAAGCSTMAITREAMKRPTRTCCPVRVTSATSTTPRPWVTSTRRPALVASISKVWALPVPVSITTSTRSPINSVPDVVGGDHAHASGLEIAQRLGYLSMRVHDERPVPRHGLANRPPTEDEHVERGTAALLRARRRQG